MYLELKKKKDVKKNRRQNVLTKEGITRDREPRIVTNLFRKAPRIVQVHTFVIHDRMAMVLVSAIAPSIPLFFPVARFSKAPSRNSRFEQKGCLYECRQQCVQLVSSGFHGDNRRLGPRSERSGREGVTRVGTRVKQVEISGTKDCETRAILSEEEKRDCAFQASSPLVLLIFVPIGCTHECTTFVSRLKKQFSDSGRVVYCCSTVLLQRILKVSASF